MFMFYRYKDKVYTKYAYLATTSFDKKISSESCGCTTLLSKYVWPK